MGRPVRTYGTQRRQYTSNSSKVFGVSSVKPKESPAVTSPDLPADPLESWPEVLETLNEIQKETSEKGVIRTKSVAESENEEESSGSEDNEESSESSESEDEDDEDDSEEIEPSSESRGFAGSSTSSPPHSVDGDETGSHPGICKTSHLLIQIKPLTLLSTRSTSTRTSCQSRRCLPNRSRYTTLHQHLARNPSSLCRSREDRGSVIRRSLSCDDFGRFINHQSASAKNSNRPSLIRN